MKDRKGRADGDKRKGRAPRGFRARGSSERQWATRDWEVQAEHFVARISKLNQGEARDYLAYLKAGSGTGKGAKGATLAGNAQALWRFDQYLQGKKTFGQIGRKDVERFFNTLDGKESTKSFYRAKVKAFYSRRYPERAEELSNWIKVRRLGSDRTPTDMLTPEEVRAIIGGCTTTRDRAAVALLYDSGLRFSEFLNLRIMDVVVRPNGLACISLPEGFEGMKTGRRDVTIFESVPYLTAWLNVHPARGDPKAPLWPPATRAGHRSDRPVHAQSLDNVVKEAAQRARVTKHVTMHLFRHSRATELARRGWNEEKLRRQFGWARSSSMPSYYTHLAQSDVENQVLLDNQLLEKTPEKEERLDVKCYWCGSSNPVDFTFCGKCSKPISMETAIELRRKEKILELEEEKVSLSGEKNPISQDALVQALRQLLASGDRLPPQLASAGRPSAPGESGPAAATAPEAPSAAGVRKGGRSPRPRRTP